MNVYHSLQVTSICLLSGALGASCDEREGVARQIRVDLGATQPTEVTAFNCSVTSGHDLQGGHPLGDINLLRALDNSLPWRLCPLFTDNSLPLFLGEKKSAFATYKVKAAASAHPLQMEAY